MVSQNRIIEANAAGLRHAAHDGPVWGYYTGILQVAYDLGRWHGIDTSTLPIVEGWRYGDAPASGLSTNHADDRSERGLSLAALAGTGETGSVIFFRDRVQSKIYRGLLLPYTGSDGEPLILVFDLVEDED